MAASSFSVNNAAGVATVFTLQSQDLKETRYIVTASTLAEPQMCIISHDTKAPGAKGTDRHTVRFTKIRLDADSAPQTVSDSRTISVPRSTTITETDIKDQRAFMNNFLTEAVLLSLIDSVTP